MNSAQTRLVLLCALLVESVWIYCAVAVLSLTLHPEGSPITWVAALAIMLVSFLVARGLSLVVMPVWMPYTLQMVMGALTIYLTLATQIPSAQQWFDLGWLSGVFAEARPDNFVRSAALGGFYSAVFWLRGGRLASAEFPLEHLTFTFRLGVIVLSTAAIVDIFNAANLRVFLLMFVFFAAGLVGMSIGHILPSVGRTASLQTWSRVLGAVIGGIVLLGLLFSLLHRGVLTFIATPLLFLLNILATVFFFVVIVPLVYILEFIISSILRFLLQFAGERPEREEEVIGGAQDFLQQLRESADPTEPSIWLQLLAGLIIAMITLVVLVILARAFRRNMRWQRIDNEDEDRETLDGDFDPTKDLARLLFGLLPERFRRRRVNSRLRLPDDEQNIVDVFRIYFGMLNLAESRGESRHGSQTPTEYQPTLSRLIPSRLVQMATTAFNRACYGRRPATSTDISEMQQLLEQAADDK